MLNNQEIRNLLEEKREDLYTSDLEKNVIDIILNEGGEDIKTFVGFIEAYGCSSGHVESLVYYNQTKDFFIANIEEIFELLEEEASYSNIPSTLLNHNALAWFSFERVVNRLVEELGILE